MTQSVFRCYAEQGPDDEYYAICLDLNLVDRRATLDEAIAALDEDILGYLASVRATGDGATAIPRPARRSAWLHFYRLSLQNTLLTLFGRRIAGFLAYTKAVTPSSAPAVMQLVYA